MPAIPSDNASPRWPALLALLAVGGLYYALPESLMVGPKIFFPALIVLMAIPTVITHKMGHAHWNQAFGYSINGLETVALLGSVIHLVAGLPKHTEGPVALLHAAALLWVTNIIVFALWYWRLDAGGPHNRDSRLGHRKGAFLFPQMTLAPDDCNYDENWSPDFVDYLFLAFNTSTALSPTDSPVISRWGKALMMIQALVSVTILTVVTARAVNVL